MRRTLRQAFGDFWEYGRYNVASVTGTVSVHQVEHLPLGDSYLTYAMLPFDNKCLHLYRGGQGNFAVLEGFETPEIRNLMHPLQTSTMTRGGVTQKMLRRAPTLSDVAHLGRGLLVRDITLSFKDLPFIAADRCGVDWKKYAIGDHTPSLEL